MDRDRRGVARQHAQRALPADRQGAVRARPLDREVLDEHRIEPSLVHHTDHGETGLLGQRVQNVEFLHPALGLQQLSEPTRRCEFLLA